MLVSRSIVHLGDRNIIDWYEERLSAWAIVDGAQRENCGIMVDTWRFSKGTPDFELLRSLPGDRLVSLRPSISRKVCPLTVLFDQWFKEDPQRLKNIIKCSAAQNRSLGAYERRSTALVLLHRILSKEQR
jgi:hypothetical protein